MRATVIIGYILLITAATLRGQDIPGLSYCLLFDSNLEKLAFHKTADDCDPMIYLLAYRTRDFQKRKSTFSTVVASRSKV